MATDLTQAERIQRARNWLIDGQIADGYPLHDAPIVPTTPLKKPTPPPTSKRTTRRSEPTLMELADEL